MDAEIDAALSGLDLFMPSYEEAVRMSGETEPERIADFFTKKVSKIRL